MKGIIFTEIIRWAEELHSPALVDEVITKSGVPNDGAYTSVGNYPHAEAIALLVAMSEQTKRPVSELARAYGHWLAGRFVKLYPDLVNVYPDAKSLLIGVGDHIHHEVTKLYPEASPPEVKASQDGDRLQLDYQSHRPFSDIAHGLIEGFIDHFGGGHSVQRETVSSDGTSARFVVI